MNKERKRGKDERCEANSKKIIGEKIDPKQKAKEGAADKQGGATQTRRTKLKETAKRRERPAGGGAQALGTKTRARVADQLSPSRASTSARALITP